MKPNTRRILRNAFHKCRTDVHDKQRRPPDMRKCVVQTSLSDRAEMLSELASFRYGERTTLYTSTCIRHKSVCKGPHTPIVKLCSLTVQKTARKTELNVLWHSTGFPSGFVGFFFDSSVCLLVRVTMVDKNKAVVCCLLATSAIMLSEKKKRKRKM